MFIVQVSVNAESPEQFKHAFRAQARVACRCRKSKRCFFEFEFPTMRNTDILFSRTLRERLENDGWEITAWASYWE